VPNQEKLLSCPNQVIYRDNRALLVEDSIAESGTYASFLILIFR
jgi:hypothetical protein